MCSSGIGAILNPVGALADKAGGVGKIIDPVQTIGRKVGGPTGATIDPAGFMRKPDKYDKQRRTLVNQEQSFLGGGQLDARKNNS